MATGSELVKRGAVGTGAAQIFQSNVTDPVSSYVAGRQLNQPDPELQKEDRKRRDEQWDEYWDWQPEKIWERFDDYGKEYLDNYRTFTRNLELAGVDPNNPNVRNLMKDKQSEVDNNFKKTFAIKEVYGEAREFAKSEEAQSRYKENTLIPQLNDLLWSPNGQSIKPPNQVNIVKDWKAIQENSENFDMNKTWKIIMDGFGDKVVQLWDTVNTKNGKVIRNTESLKGKLWEYEKDANGNPIMEANEATGEMEPKILMEADGVTPVVRVTDDTYPVFMEDKYMKKWLQDRNPYDEVEQAGQHKQWNMTKLSEMAKQRVPFDYRKKATGSETNINMVAGFDGSGAPLDETVDMFEIIERTVNMDADVKGAWSDLGDGYALDYVKGGEDSQLAKDQTRVAKAADRSKIYNIQKESENGLHFKKRTNKTQTINLIPEFFDVDVNGKKQEGYMTKTTEGVVVEMFIPVGKDQDSRRSAARTLINIGQDIGMFTNKQYNQATHERMYDYYDKNAKSGGIYDDEEDDSGGIY